MKEESAIILEDFLSENWDQWESFCKDRDRDTDAESILVEVQEQTGQY